MSSSKPVPGFRFPKAAVAYHCVCHAIAGLASIASRASSGLSPSLSQGAERGRAHRGECLSRDGGTRAGRAVRRGDFEDGKPASASQHGQDDDDGGR